MSILSKLVRTQLIINLQTANQLDLWLPTETKEKLNALLTELESLNASSMLDDALTLDKDDLLNLVRIASHSDAWQIKYINPIDEETFSYMKKNHAKLANQSFADTMTEYIIERRIDNKGINYIRVITFPIGMKIFLGDESIAEVPDFLSATALFLEIQEACNCSN